MTVPSTPLRPVPSWLALQADGYPDECITEGVCKYVDIGDGPVSYEPTTGGKGKSESGSSCECCVGMTLAARRAHCWRQGLG